MLFDQDSKLESEEQKSFAKIASCDTIRADLGATKALGIGGAAGLRVRV
jgi:hypothetical protein